MRYLKLCLECEQGVVDQHFVGDEGWGVCDECGAVEGETEEVTEEEFEQITRR